MENKNYKSCVDYILSIPKFTKKTTSENIKNVLKELSNPELDLKYIHIAGTNGKGSVTEFTSNILFCEGYRVGMFISPHLVKINERISISGEDISDEDFIKTFELVKEATLKIVEKKGEHLSFFEFLFVMAVVYFNENHVEIAVLETGLGGRLDATNIIDNTLVCAITSIGLEHTEILGDTVEKIAFEKAGIIKTNCKVTFNCMDLLAKKVIFNKCILQKIEHDDIIDATCKKYVIEDINNKNIIFFTCYNNEDRKFSLPFLAKYQCENAITAISIIELLNKYKEYNISYKSVYEGLKTSKWPCRMEQILDNVFIDGGHNIDGIKEFVDSALTIVEKRKSIILFSCVKEKNYDIMIKNICDSMDISVIIVTDILGDRNINDQVLINTFKRYTSVPIIKEPNIKKAFEKALEIQKDDVVFVVGSLYMAGEIKKILPQICVEKYKMEDYSD